MKCHEHVPLILAKKEKQKKELIYFGSFFMFFLKKSFTPARDRCQSVQGEVEGGKSEEEEKKRETAAAVKNKAQNIF